MTEEELVTLDQRPHVTVGAAELATWVDRQGADLRWNIVGDRLLTGYLSTPVRGDEMADLLRRINRDLILEDPREGATGRGEQRVTAADLDAFTVPIGGFFPPRVNDRTLTFAWAATPKEEWELHENSDATARRRRWAEEDARRAAEDGVTR